jgi:hypothetical protein
MSKHYFTFGQDHAHAVNGFTFDKDVVAVIEAQDSSAARDRMFEVFGPKWAFQYDITPPDMSDFPRGFKEIPA